jgi:hypothetical protein
VKCLAQGPLVSLSKSKSDILKFSSKLIFNSLQLETKIAREKRWKIQHVGKNISLDSLFKSGPGIAFK